MFTTPIISFYYPKCYLACLREGILPTEPAYDKEKVLLLSGVEAVYRILIITGKRFAFDIINFSVL